jgi:hypothetical protein
VLLEFHLPTPRCNPQLELHLCTPETQRKPSSFDARRTHTCRSLENAVPHFTDPFGHQCETFPAPFFVENLAPRRRLPPSTTEWQTSIPNPSSVPCLCVSWVFYRDAQQRDDRGNTVYHPQFFARVSAPNQDTFIMRMSSEWFEAARRYTDSPSLGRCVHHVRGTMIKKALRKQVHRPQFTPKDWEFEVLTKLMVLGQQPAQAQEPTTHEITSFGPTLSTFDSPSGHHCAGIPKSKGERLNPIKHAGKEATAKNNPRCLPQHVLLCTATTVAV